MKTNNHLLIKFHYTIKSKQQIPAVKLDKSIIKLAN